MEITGMTSDLLPEGLQDRLPPFAEGLAAARRAMMDVLASHGYARIQPPMIEYERSLSSRMDGVSRDRMFRFVDPVSLRMLALRSDITMQVGRVASTSLAAAPRPLRLSYCGPVLNIRAGQLEPERERTQLGAELVGSDSVAAATEIVTMAIEALKAAGVQNISVDFTLPDLVDTLARSAFPLDAVNIEAVRGELDAKDAGGLAALGADAYLPLLYAAGPIDQALERLAAIDAGGALASRIAGLKQVASAVKDNVKVTLDPTERHGFEYQSWFGFSLFSADYAGTLGRGGTYTIKHADGNPEAATGFSLFPDPLISSLISIAERKCVFLPLGHDAAAADALRIQGWCTIAAIQESDDAKALGCSHILNGEQPQKIT